mgnify:CR=1 FL=1
MTSQRISAALVALCLILDCSSFSPAPISTTHIGPNNQLLHRSSPQLASTAATDDGDASFLDKVTKTYETFQKASTFGRTKTCDAARTKRL